MPEFGAVFYDGRTSARSPVRVSALGEHLRIVGEGIDIEVPIGQARLDAPIAGAKQVIRLSDGAQLDVSNDVELATLFPRRHRLEGWVLALERRWRYALAAMALIAVAGGWAALYGLPLAAEFVAGFVPRDVEARLGEHTLTSIDRALCKPSNLSAVRQQSLREGFEGVSAGLGDEYRYHLEMRSCSRLGPNAFALPGGAVVLTDELVELAANDAQISAVLAHEVGHVRQRHGLRQALQAAGLAALITALAGDAVAITNLAAALPTMLLQSGYSREFENEADGYAIQRLKEIGIPPRRFAEILMRLEGHRRTGAAADTTTRNGVTLDYLSTHPATAQRVERALAADTGS